MNRVRKILILAGDTDGNIGDRAIMFSMCHEFRRINPKLEITFVSGNPGADSIFFGVETVPRGIRGLPALIKAAKMSDLILCGGGGLFQDDDSLVKMPYWAIRIAMVRAINKKIIGYSLGVGPLKKITSRLFARLAFACMEHITVRDNLAKETAETLTSNPVYVIPDPGLLLPSAPREEAIDILERNNIPLNGVPIIGVAARKWFHQSSAIIPHKYAVKYNLRKIPGKEKCEKMIHLLAEVLDRVVANYKAFILFLPTYNVSHEADNLICKKIMHKMNSPCTKLLNIYNPMLYKAVTGCMTAMLGVRMHPTIFAADAGTNIVGLAYNQKFFGFFELLGIQSKVIPVADFVANDQKDKLFDLLSEAVVSEFNLQQKVLDLKNNLRKFNECLLNCC